MDLPSGFVDHCLKAHAGKLVKLTIDMQDHIHKLCQAGILACVDKHTALVTLAAFVDALQSSVPAAGVPTCFDAFDLLHDFLNLVQRREGGSLGSTLHPLQHLHARLQQVVKQVGAPSIAAAITVFNLNPLTSAAAMLPHLDRVFVCHSASVNTTPPPKHFRQDATMEPTLFGKHLVAWPDVKAARPALLDNCFTLSIHCTKRTWLHLHGSFDMDHTQAHRRIVFADLVAAKQKFIRERLAKQPAKAFAASYMAVCNLHWLLVLPPEKLLAHVLAKYQLFLSLTHKPFPQVMEHVMQKTMSLSDICDTIRMLLLGDEDDVQIANSIFVMLKDRRVGADTLANLVCGQMPLAHQAKLGRSAMGGKPSDLERGEVLLTPPDMKKQLAMNRHIPSSIKAMAMEKVNEMKMNNNEHFKQYTFVKTILSYPWPAERDNDVFMRLHDRITDARVYLSQVECRLDDAVFGQANVKKQMMLHAAKWIANPHSAGCAIALEGPPGVGKTLMAKSIAQALDLPIVQIMLGGQNDGELLHGHGYTYAGAQPGILVRKMAEVGKRRVIIYFDELDKTTSKHGGVNEINSILIHLTDPNTNRSFQDRFFQGIDFPMDKVMFIFAYNDKRAIDPILLDRFVQLKVAPYTTEEKLRIVQDHMLPELQKVIGLRRSLEVDEPGVREFISTHSHQAGVRDLRRRLEELLLEGNLEHIRSGATTPIRIDLDALLTAGDGQGLQQRHHPRTNGAVGVANGLYATTMGIGGVLEVQVTARDNQDTSLSITGSVGDVMKESVLVAYECALRLVPNSKRRSFNVHFPAAAVPKDGPSAGAAVALAFVSALSNRCVLPGVAVTGETDLYGNIGSIGGLDIKIKGAKESGINVVYLPHGNEAELRTMRINQPTCITVATVAALVERCLEQS